MSVRAVFTGLGHAVPKGIMTNDDLSKIVDTNDAWIRQRTGIAQRYICSPEETSVSLSIEAANEAIAAAKIDPNDIELVICGTVTPDHIFPSAACLIQSGIGANNAGAFDLGAACAGFIYSLSVGASMIEAGHMKNVLVIGVDTLSKHVDWTDRSTCVLFGDGAGAAVLQAEEGGNRGLMSTVLLSDGNGGKHIQIDAGGSKFPMSRKESYHERSTIFMAGNEVYRFAVGAMGDACLRILDSMGMTSDDIDLLVPHQANLRIIKSAQERLGLPDEKVFVNVDRYGNTSGGSIAIAMYEAEKMGLLKPGSKIMTVGFGAGLVWGANLIVW